ncbi:hypothetical protein EVAR_70646_1 [Eumeta japonica]|uniref:Uncharacterized protein n=1 Tax=Eumeta variegata TaxID=151549 RepID=A0A4C1SZD9_EUMVA|nr:hypothetical protein EVAR_70646_1 [Eumeta japonica]
MELLGTMDFTSRLKDIKQLPIKNETPAYDFLSVESAPSLHQSEWHWTSLETECKMSALVVIARRSATVGWNPILLSTLPNLKFFWTA